MTTRKHACNTIHIFFATGWCGGLYTVHLWASTLCYNSLAFWALQISKHGTPQLREERSFRSGVEQSYFPLSRRRLRLDAIREGGESLPVVHVLISKPTRCRKSKTVHSLQKARRREIWRCTQTCEYARARVALTCGVFHVNATSSPPLKCEPFVSSRHRILPKTLPPSANHGATLLSNDKSFFSLCRSVHNALLHILNTPDACFGTYCVVRRQHLLISEGHERTIGCAVLVAHGHFWYRERRDG